MAPQGVYPCAGDDQWLAISVRSDAEWRALAAAIGAPELSSLDYAERRARHDALDARIESWTRTQEPAAAAATLQGVGVAASRVLDAVAIHDDPHLDARGYWLRLPHPKMTPWKQPVSSWRLVEARPVPRRHAPLFGEHNREILCDLLGHPESELSALKESGVIGDAPVNPGIG
jgi:crotonobetainyl-CoA:carnitine CoA-transferase CaiB-like acyl-CoA transferase